MGSWSEGRLCWQRGSDGETGLRLSLEPSAEAVLYLQIHSGLTGLGGTVAWSVPYRL